MSLQDFDSWLAQSGPSQLIKNVDWIIPVVQSIHILAIAALMASAVLVNLRIAGILGRDQPISAFTLRYMPRIWAFLVVLAASGAVLIVGEPERTLPNPVFWTKMGLLVFAISITAFTKQRSVRAENSVSGESPRQRSLGLPLIALTIWVAIVFCGRWIAYTFTP